MRARNIKPALYENEDFVECSIPARYLFPALWCFADCEGRLENRPKRLRLKVFPFDDVDVPELLNELAAAGFIKFYGGDDSGAPQPYIWIENFTKHQTPHIKERKKGSDLPPHPDDIQDQPCASPVPVPDQPCASPVPVPDQPCASPVPAKLIADTRYLNPERGLLNADTRTPIPESLPKSSESVSAVLSKLGFQSPDDAKKELLSRLMALGDGPEYEPWWRKVINRMEATNGLGVLLDGVDHAEQCKEPAFRSAKGMGELSTPAAYVAGECRNHLKRRKKNLPRAPASRKQRCRP